MQNLNREDLTSRKLSPLMQKRTRNYGLEDSIQQKKTPRRQSPLKSMALLENSSQFIKSSLKDDSFTASTRPSEGFKQSIIITPKDIKEAQVRFDYAEKFFANFKGGASTKSFRNREKIKLNAPIRARDIGLKTEAGTNQTSEYKLDYRTPQSQAHISSRNIKGSLNEIESNRSFLPSLYNVNKRSSSDAKVSASSIESLNSIPIRDSQQSRVLDLLRKSQVSIPQLVIAVSGY